MTAPYLRVAYAGYGDAFVLEYTFKNERKLVIVLILIMITTRGYWRARDAVEEFLKGYDFITRASFRPIVPGIDWAYPTKKNKFAVYWRGLHTDDDNRGMVEEVDDDAIEQYNPDAQVYLHPNRRAFDGYKDRQVMLKVVTSFQIQLFKNDSLNVSFDYSKPVPVPVYEFSWRGLVRALMMGMIQIAANIGQRIPENPDKAALIIGVIQAEKWSKKTLAALICRDIEPENVKQRKRVFEQQNKSVDEPLWPCNNGGTGLFWTF